MTAEPISVADYADEVVAGWPPLTDAGKADLARILTPVVRELAAKKAAAKAPALRTPSRRAA